MKPLAVLIPERIDIEEIVNVNSSLFEEDYLRYLINTIVIKQGRIVENKELNNEKDLKQRKYQNASKEYIRIESLKNGSQHEKHKELIKYLCQNNVEIHSSRTRMKLISICERTRSVQEEPFKYRFSEYFRENKLRIEFIKDYKIINAFKKQHSKCDGELNTGTFKFLSKFFNQDKLQIDLEKAVELCEQRYGEHQKYGVYVKEMMQIVNLYNGIYRLTFKRNSLGRIYTNITQLPKVYREFITYDNKQLSEIDISNSVIFFLGLLLDETLNKNLIIDLFNKNIYNLLNEESYSYYHSFYKSFESLSQKETQLLKILGSNGKFYDEFISDFDKTYPFEQMKYFYESENDGIYTGTESQIRKVCKKRLLAMLFAQSKHYEQEQEIFKTKFPELLERINKFKDVAGHEKLSHILFQIEACFVVDIVARKFNRKYWKTTPIFTLHDCLITTSDYIGKLEQVFNDSFIEYLGCVPKTEVKEW
ncbi:hypothetical protein [Chryseobacterium bernardetii]|uniref:hypothetical protein n=1 Tax=Chryseobacterium bernardetii TaxID=1241978 RepID=UPI0030175733